MKLEEGRLYPVFNQENNRQKIFFQRKNYLFFLKKMRGHVLPYADVIAWCLPDNYRESNHYHLMVLVREVESEGFTSSETFTTHAKNQNLNYSIGGMLRSYTRVINKKEGASGSFFRQVTKAQCLNCPEGITPSFFQTANGTQICLSNPEKEYPHDYFGNRNGKWVNRKITNEYLELSSPDSQDDLESPRE